MKSRKPSVAVDRGRSADFILNAESFAAEAKHAMHAERWNPAGALYILAAIAWCDAVTVAKGGKKSTGENHGSAAALLQEVVTDDPKGAKDAAKSFRLLIGEKTAVSYGGEPFDRADLERIEKYYEAFTLWCRRVAGRAS